MENNRGFEFLTGIVVGGVIGAATVLLMAPASGEKTREQIRARSSELKDRGSALGSEAKVQVQKATKEGHKRVLDVQEDTRLALEEQKTRLAEAIDAGKQAASRRKDDLMSRIKADKAPDAIVQV